MKQGIISADDKRVFALLYWKILDKMTDKQFESFRKIKSFNKAFLWLRKNMKKEIQEILKEINQENKLKI